MTTETMQYLCDPLARLRHWSVTGEPVDFEGTRAPASGAVTTFTPQEALGRIVAQARAEGLPVQSYLWYVTEVDGPPNDGGEQERTEIYMRGFAEGQAHGLFLAGQA